MNRRSVTLIVVVVAVIGAVYAITWWQRSRETQRLLVDLKSWDHGVATKAMTGLRERAPAISGQLIWYLRDGDDHLRWRAAMLLGNVRGQKAREALVAALQDPSANVRLNAALALGRLGARGAADRISMLAENRDEEVPVRAAAVRALQLLRSHTHLAEVTELAAADRPPPPPPPPPPAEEGAEVEEEAPEPPPDVTAPLRKAAVRAAAVLGADAHMRAGAVGEATDSPAMRAAELLAESSSSESEPNADVRQAACYALGDLAKLVADDEVRSAVIKALVAASEDEVADVRVGAIHALRLIDPPSEDLSTVERVMEDAVNDDHYWVRQAASEATQGG